MFRSKRFWLVCLGALCALILIVSAYRFMFSTGVIAFDFTVYRTAASQVLSGGPLYAPPPWTTPYVYVYHPLFAVLYTPLARIPEQAAWIVSVVILIILSMLGLWRWYKVVDEMDPDRAHRYAIWWPLFLFTTDWLFMTIYGQVEALLILLAAELTLALLRRQNRKASLILSVIVLMKFQWAFPLLLLVYRKEFVQLVRVIVGGLLGYLAWTALLLVLTGRYGLAQLQAYYTMLTSISRSYPWQGQEAMFDTFQHSIYQTWLRYFGLQPWTGPATTICKVALIVVSLYALSRLWRHPINNRLGLLVILAGYCLGMLLLDKVEEAALTAIIFLILPDTAWLVLSYLFYGLFFMVASFVPQLAFLNINHTLPIALIVLLINWVALLRRGDLQSSEQPELTVPQSGLVEPK